jgi:hypothetical protein
VYPWPVRGTEDYIVITFTIYNTKLSYHLFDLFDLFDIEGEKMQHFTRNTQPQPSSCSLKPHLLVSREGGTPPLGEEVPR